LVLLCLLLFAGALYGQSIEARGLSLGAEMQNLEKLAGGTNLSPRQRQETLSSIARLRELSGDIEGAAQFWFDAAAADQAGQDEPLLRSAVCYAAMGEWEKALALARTVSLNNQNRQSLIRARLLEAQIEAFSSAENSTPPLAGTDAGASLISLLAEEGFEAYKPSIYYTLWKLSGAEDWKDRLIGEYPRSPEGRIAAAESGKVAVSAAPMPLWLLFPGRGGIVPSPATAAVEPAKAPPADPAPKASAGEPGAGPVLQAGLFSSEANALELAERLRRAGFNPQIGRRTVKGREYYTVNVSFDGDINKTIRELAGAGFESFPVF
jgi:tetratricopeptide (TPR) repeat protein